MGAAARPMVAGLIEYLKRQHRSYDALVFFSLWHPLTVHGLRSRPSAACCFRICSCSRRCASASGPMCCVGRAALGFFSDAERRLLHAYVGIRPQHEELVGIGDRPAAAAGVPAAPAGSGRRDRRRRRCRAPRTAPTMTADVSRRPRRAVPAAPPALRPFALYGGRVEPDNGCEEMLEYFDTYAAADGDTALVLMGVKMMKVPEAAVPATGRRAARSRADDGLRGRRRHDRARRQTICSRSRCSKAWPSARRCWPARGTRPPSSTAAAPTPACTTRTATSSSERCGC